MLRSGSERRPLAKLVEVARSSVTVLLPALVAVVSATEPCGAETPLDPLSAAFQGPPIEAPIARIEQEVGFGRVAATYPREAWGTVTEPLPAIELEVDLPFTIDGTTWPAGAYRFHWERSPGPVGADGRTARGEAIRGTAAGRAPLSLRLAPIDRETASEAATPEATASEAAASEGATSEGARQPASQRLPLATAEEGSDLLTVALPTVEEGRALLEVRWGPSRGSWWLEFDLEEQILERVEALRQVAGPSEGRLIWEWASYCYRTGLLLEPALEWVQELSTLGEFYWTVALEARLLAATDRWPEAAEAGERALALAAGESTDPGVAADADLLTELLESWQATDDSPEVSAEGASG